MDPSGLKVAKSKRASQRKESAHTAVFQPNAAGIDIGAREIFVAVPADRDDHPVGFLANRRRRELLPLCRRLLEVPLTRSTTSPDSEPTTSCSWLCPHCGGTMIMIERLTPQQTRRRSVERKGCSDTS
jgi:hypothetical protein